MTEPRCSETFRINHRFWLRTLTAVKILILTRWVNSPSHVDADCSVQSIIPCQEELLPEINRIIVLMLLLIALVRLLYAVETWILCAAQKDSLNFQ